LRAVDGWGKAIFFVLLLFVPLIQWHMVYFYNNLFFSLLWGQLVLTPLWGSSLAPWERCAIALVMVWLRPQWMIVAVPVASSALIAILVAPSRDRRFVRDTILVTLAALVVAWLGAVYWVRTAAHLQDQQTKHNADVSAAIAAHQDPRVLELHVTTQPVEKLKPPPPPLFSERSATVVAWAYRVTRNGHALSLDFLFALTLLALVTLGRRGIVFLVPLASSMALVVGTAVFARNYPEFAANSGALERMQLIVPVLTAGLAAALYHRVSTTAPS
jgi:hypothetical protein